MQQGYSDDYLKKTIHHEFSSILIHNNSFPVKNWMAVLPNDFSYAKSVEQEVTAINSGWKPETPAPEIFEKGFLTKYGMSTMENDINTYAEMLFTEPERLKNLAREYIDIERKYAILTAFYRNLDKTHTWFFEN
jgi:hypothetical protein